MKPFLQGSVPLSYLPNAKSPFMSWWRSAFNEVNDWALRLKGQQNLVLCGMFQLVLTTPAQISFNTICIISIIRYYMTWKTNQLELYKKNRIFISVCAVYIGENLLNLSFLIMALMDFPVITLATLCSGMHMKHGVKTASTRSGAQSFPSLMADICQDKNISLKELLH